MERPDTSPRPAPRAGRPLACALLLLVSIAHAQGPPPFRIDGAAIHRVETGLSERLHLRYPLWYPGPDSTTLALQAYSKNGVEGIVTVPAVSRQVLGGQVRASSTTMPPGIDPDRELLRTASCVPGSWYAWGDPGRPVSSGLLYVSNQSKVAKMGHTVFGGPSSLWFKGRLLAAAGGDTCLANPSQVPASPVIVCALGRRADVSAIAALTAEDPRPRVLFAAHDTSAYAPALSPDGKLVAFLQTTSARTFPMLNLMALNQGPGGITAGRPQFSSPFRESSTEDLGTVTAFSWCPRTFKLPRWGEYGLIAYYRQVITARDDAADGEDRYDLWIVPVSLQSRKLMTKFAFRVVENVSIERSQQSLPPSWRSTKQDGETTYLFFLKAKLMENPLQVARIVPDMHLSLGKIPAQTWEMGPWSGKQEARPINVSVSCSGDGRFLALTAQGAATEVRTATQENVYYEQAYIVPLVP